MSPTLTFNETEEQWAQELIGRRIVSAEVGHVTRPYEDPEAEVGILTLDDGTKLSITPNKGGCVCGAGDYFLNHFEAGSGGLITSARLTSEVDGYYEEDQTWELFVMCEGVAGEQKIMQIEGSDGNGYYGTGYIVEVVRVA